jgi:orotate phosphoribosyltransferase
MTQMTTDAERLAEQIFLSGAVKFGEFKLKLHEKNPTAPLSPIYIDLRVLRSFPRAFNAAVRMYDRLLDDFPIDDRFDVLVDIPTAATPFVGALAYVRNFPMLSPRKDPKTHGLEAKMDGALNLSMKRAVLIDDLVTQADTKLEAAAVVRQTGLEVKDVVVLLDREQGGPETLAKEGLTCHAAMTLTQLLDYLRGRNHIAQEQVDRVNAYRSA